MSLLHIKRRDHHANIQSVGFDHALQDPNGQQPAPFKVPRRRSSGLKFFASSAAPKMEDSKESHKAWEADYLKSLRGNRPARPGGSRPLPERAAASIPEPYARASSAMSFRPDLSNGRYQERCTSALSHRRAQSYLPCTTDGVGRPVIPQPTTGESMKTGPPSAATEAPLVTPSGTYRESGMRWMEKQEARSLREALEDMDIRDETRIRSAAQDEASELVWEHRNKEVPKRDQYQPYSYKQHLEKGAHARSQSLGWYATNRKASDNGDPFQQSVPTQPVFSHVDKSSSLMNRNTSVTFQEPHKDSRCDDVLSGQTHDLWDSAQKKAYMSLSTPKFLPKMSGRRRSSGPRARNVSGGLFRNPDDKIYEEPDVDKALPAMTETEHSKIPVPLTLKTRNVISRMSTHSQSFPHARRSSSGEKQKTHGSEIHKNPPSQSRDPLYLRNEKSLTSAVALEAKVGETDTVTAHFKDGKEIRSDDIKAATSMRMKDRSPKLPSPTVVSDRPGRPIVSFDKGWKPKDIENKDISSASPPSGVPPRLRSKPQLPASTASAPIIPTIRVPDPPSIQVNDAPPNEISCIPTISITETPAPSISPPEDHPTSRPLPSPMTRPRPSPANRPLPHHSSTTPVHSSKLHWSPSSRRATAQCAACALPIEGRIVSAASQRFHPHCFTCHHCAEALECVAFYPEPDSAKEARLARIEARAAGALDEAKSGETALDDGDPSPRFYCHLDFHELFSPRCRSCKTPIESEVVIACGASWHVGHFFCAQCGDPFNAKTPFVEKDGYAWCVGCHAGRFSGKCKGCKKAVVDGGVVALGGEWHAECFCCVVSICIAKVQTSVIADNA